MTYIEHPDASRSAITVSERPAARLMHFAAMGVYCALAVIFIWFGALKFTDYEAGGIAGLILNSPFVGWWYGLLGIKGTAALLGVVEITTGLLLGARLLSPRVSQIGAAFSTLTFLITFSFFFTTPIVPEPLAGGFPAISIQPGQFLLKDLVLLAVSVYLVAESTLALELRKAAVYRPESY